MPNFYGFGTSLIWIWENTNLVSDCTYAVCILNQLENDAIVIAGRCSKILSAFCGYLALWPSPPLAAGCSADKRQSTQIDQICYFLRAFPF